MGQNHEQYNRPNNNVAPNQNANAPPAPARAKGTICA